MSQRFQFTARFVLLTTVLTISIGLLSWRVINQDPDRPLFPPDDFVEYWAAGKLNALGQDPYSPELLLPLQIDAGRDTDEAIMMWNPPWTLPIVMPFGLLKPKIAHLLWTLLGFGLIIWSADQCWTLFSGDREKRWIAWIFSLSYIPSLFVLQAGQIGSLLLFGFVLGLRGITYRQPWQIGCSVFILAIKPHLVYLLWPALGVWLIVDTSGIAKRSAVSFFVIMGLACLIAWLPNHQVFAEYWEATRHRPPDQWKSPTIGSWLRELCGPDLFWLQFVPMTLGIIWFTKSLLQSREVTQKRRLLSLVIISFVTASYGAWPFDLVLLLPYVVIISAQWIRLSSNLQRLMFAGYFLWTCGAIMLNRLHFTSEYFWWMAPSLLVLWLIGRQDYGEDR